MEYYFIFVFLLTLGLLILSGKIQSNPGFFVWRGRMVCCSCGYTWMSRRKNPPARCAGCSSRNIEPLHGHSSLTLSEFNRRQEEKKGVVSGKDEDPGVDVPAQPTPEEKLTEACRHVIEKTDGSYCVICDEKFFNGSLLGRYIDHQLPGRGFCTTVCLHQWEEKVATFKETQDLDIFSTIRHRSAPKCPYCENVSDIRMIKEGTRTVDYRCGRCAKPFFALR